MLLFLNDDRAYQYWLAHHRQGFVLDCTRKPDKKHLTLHRATCAQIKRAPSKRTHWTTGPHMKGCALDAAELADWAREQTGSEPTPCADCMSSTAAPIEEPVHLTPLDRDILDCVLEIATYHIDLDDAAYHLTVGMIARCLGKTEGQLAAAFERLVAQGLLFIDARRMIQRTHETHGPSQLSAGRLGPPAARKDVSLSGAKHKARAGRNERVFPTIKALQTLDEYRSWDEARLAAELQKLGHEE